MQGQSSFSLLALTILLLTITTSASRILSSDSTQNANPTATSAVSPVVAGSQALSPTAASIVSPTIGASQTVSPIATSFVPPAIPDSQTAGPSSTSAVTPAVAPVASANIPTGDHPLTFFMHDILGGSNPSARIVAGIVDDMAVSSQLPFARPNGAVLPLNSGVNVNSANNGAINNNNIPFLTGLGGTTNAVNTNNGNGNSNGVPFFAGGSLPQGTTLQGLLFGTMTVVDDELTEGPQLGSGSLGKAQGFYVVSSVDGASQTLALTVMFKAGEYADSISFFGVHRTIDSESHLAIIGGTGKYVNAQGFAKIAVDRSAATQHETDGVETVLEFTVYLA